MSIKLFGEWYYLDVQALYREKSLFKARLKFFFTLFLLWEAVYAYDAQIGIWLIEGSWYGIKWSIIEFYRYLKLSAFFNYTDLWIWWAKTLAWQSLIILICFVFKYREYYSIYGPLNLVRFDFEANFVFDLNNKKNFYITIKHIKVITKTIYYYTAVWFWTVYGGIWKACMVLAALYWVAVPAITLLVVLLLGYYAFEMISILFWLDTYKYFLVALWFWDSYIAQFFYDDDVDDEYDYDDYESYFMERAHYYDMYFNNRTHMTYKIYKVNWYEAGFLYVEEFFESCFIWLIAIGMTALMGFHICTIIKDTYNFDPMFYYWISMFSFWWFWGVASEPLFGYYLLSPEEQRAYFPEKAEFSYFKPPFAHVKLQRQEIKRDFRFFQIYWWEESWYNWLYIWNSFANIYAAVLFGMLFFYRKWIMDFTFRMHMLLYDDIYLDDIAEKELNLYYWHCYFSSWKYFDNFNSLFNIVLDIRLCVPEFFFFFNLLLFICFIYLYYYFNTTNSVITLSYLKQNKEWSAYLKGLWIAYLNEQSFFRKRMMPFYLIHFENMTYKQWFYSLFLRYIQIINNRKIFLKFFIEKTYFLMNFWIINIINNITINFSILNHLVLIYIYLNYFEFNWYFLFNFQIENNLLVFLIKIFVIFLSILILLLFKNQLSIAKVFNWEFFLIYNFNILALLFVITCYDLVVLFFCIEFYSLCIYILISFKQFSLYSTEAGLKYFIISSISAVIFLLGVLIFYIQLGTTNFNDLFNIFFCDMQPFCLQDFPEDSFFEYDINNIFNEFLIEFMYARDINKSFLFNYIFKLSFFFDLFIKSDYIILFLAVLLINISLFFKLNIAPFHLWTLDIYDGAPTLIMFFLNIIPKVIFFYILIKLYHTVFFPFFYEWMNLFLILALISFIVGSFGGIYQLKLKKLLIYSMIYNNGYFILIITVPTLLNMVTLFYFLLIYILNLLSFFICFINLRSSITNNQCTNIYSLTNLFRINSFLAFSFILLLFSLSGIPPFIGFLSKFYLLYSSFYSDELFIIIWISFLTSILNIFYYIRLIKIIYFTKLDVNLFFKVISFEVSVILFIILFCLLFFFITPSFFFNLIKFYFLTYF